MKKILIIEDDTKIATALAIRLEAAGYQACAAANGFEGLKMALDNRPDLILMDIWMPVGIGFSVAQRLQTLGLKGVPVIFITASKLSGLRKTARQLGAAAFFEKTYDSERLLAAIAHTLRRSHPASEAGSAGGETDDCQKTKANVRRILVVEDDEKTAAALTIRLQTAGFEVLAAANGHQGILSAASMKPDLIITDIWMPDPIGFLNKDRLQNLGLTDVPVIYITASKKKDLREIALQEGAAAFFEKPYDPKELLATVARILAQRCGVTRADSPPLAARKRLPAARNQTFHSCVSASP